jgi:leader peptidase (prepilin peptidase)/N-methyltransferase
VAAVPLAALLGALLGAAWGLAADRLAARWPAHEAEVDDSGAEVRSAGWRRPVDWRTLATAAFGALALGAALGRSGDPPEVGLLGAWVLVVTVLFATDLDQRLLPDLLTLPLAGAAFLAVLVGIDPFVAAGDLPLAVAAAVVVPGVLFALSIPFGAGAFGLGDVKFLFGFGVLAGPGRLLTAVVVGILLAGIVVVVLLALRRISLRSFIPYGPFLIIGAAWALLGPGTG